MSIKYFNIQSKKEGQSFQEKIGTLSFPNHSTLISRGREEMEVCQGTQLNYYLMGQGETTEHPPVHPFTQEELALIHMAHEHSVFDSHHHHHSHSTNVQYKRPEKLTTNIALYAFKKLNSMNPDILTEREKKLLKPVGPGITTNFWHGFLVATATVYSAYLWRSLGLKGIIRNPLSVIPSGVLIGGAIGFDIFANYIRELTWIIPRRNMVKSYNAKYGDNFLLDVLDPKFRLPQGGLQ